MMSAESGSTALLDRGLYHGRGNPNQTALQSSGVPTSGHRPTQSQVNQISSVQHIQTGSNNNQLYTGQSSQGNDIFEPSSAVVSEPPYAAAVTAPPQSRAAAPR